MYIERHREKEAEAFLKQFPVVFVSGPRQIGKTIMFTKICSHYHYCTFDDPLILNKVFQETHLFLKNHKPPLLIDEVQYAPIIFRYIKMIVDKDRKKLRLYLPIHRLFS